MKLGLHSLTQLSASEVQAFLGANLDSVSPRWTACVPEIMQSPVAIARPVYVVGVLIAVKNPITFVVEMVLTSLKPAQHTNKSSRSIK